MAIKFKLKFSKEAVNDLDGLFEYISTELSAPQSAKNLMAKIEKKVENLKIQPFLYPPCLESPLYELGYRKMVINNHVVIYDSNEENETVNIVRIFYGKQDYKRFF